MTFVYGVTKYGAKLQILKQLKDIPEFPEKYYQEGAVYLMKKIFFSIKEMFTATQEIQVYTILEYIFVCLSNQTYQLIGM